MFLAWAKSSTAVQHSRIHTNDSVEVKYYDRPTNTLDKMAFSITGDLGCEYGGGVSCHKNNPVVGTKGGPKQSFAGWMAYNRFWFKKDLFGLTVGGGVLDNPGRYLTLLPPINGADAISGSPYFPASPVHTVNHEVTFRFSGVDSPAVSEKKAATTKLSASARIGYENFPQLSSAMLDTHWPLVVEDENCQVVSTQGEDYAGPTCTGITGPVISRAAAPPNVGEDYHGFEVAPRAGNQVTIEFDLVGTWSGSASQIAATNRPGKADCLAVGGRAAGGPSP